MEARKKVLVAGGAGFIGSHICERSVAAGHDVICLDNYYTGRKQNIAHLLHRPNFRAIRQDVTSPIYLEVDEIYNLACPASPVHYQRDPVQTMKTSIHGAINLLDMAKRTGAKILQASTSEIYGDPEIHPQVEDYCGNVDVRSPRACYDEGKRAAETLFYDYRRQHGVRTKVVRIFNTYGPRMQADDGRVVSNFVMQSLRGHDLTIFGDGSQTRSFCYVDDTVAGIMAVMDTPDDVAGPVNVGNPEEITILELARKVSARTGNRISVTHSAAPEGDPRRRCPDITLIRSLTGWSPKVGIDDGLDRVIAYFSDSLGLNVESV